MSGRDCDEAISIDQEEEVDEPRIWWVLCRVCQLLGYSQLTGMPLLLWEKHPDHHHPPTLLNRFLDEAKEGSCLFFWLPPDHSDDHNGDHSHNPAAANSNVAAMSTFTRNFDDNTDDPGDDPPDSGHIIQRFMEEAGSDLLLHVGEGIAPDTIGIPGVLLKKMSCGSIPDVATTIQAQDLLPRHLHLTYLHQDTHHGLHAIFHQVYVPMCERLGRADRTAYLTSLSHTFSSLSKLRTPDPPLDYDSDEDAEGQKVALPRGMIREIDEMDEWKEGQGERKGDEEEQKKVKSPRALLLSNVNRLHSKYSQVSGDINLEELHLAWSTSFTELSSTLAHLQVHPIVTTPDEEDGDEVCEATQRLADLHAGLTDCHRSLFYLEKFFKVVSQGRLEAMSGHAGSLLEVLHLLWRLGRKHGISGRVQLILESAVESLVERVTHELRPVNLLPSSMREMQPFLDSQTKVRESLQVVAEWENAVSQCAKSVFGSAKRQQDGRQDFDPEKVLSAITSLRSVCSDLNDIMKVLLEAQAGFSGEWSALIRVEDPDQLKSITSQVLRVLTAYDFNIFSMRNQDRWVRQKEDFQLAVQKWEQAVCSAIAESFKDRMTSELVTAVAGVLQKEPCRATFRQILISHLPDLLSAFAAEVKGIRADFKAQQQVERPGTQAPLSGCVRWMATYLTKRLAAWTTLKTLYSQYQGSGAGGDLWAEVGAEVEEVQQEVEQAREQMVLEWGERVTQQIPKLLVTPVLTRDKHYCEVGGWRVQLPGELQWIVWESGQLLQAGIRPPELATHLTLHYQTLQTAAMGLHLTLKDYHSVLDELNPVQHELLKAELTGADRVLAAGQRVVTWSPAALTHFSASCRDVVEHVRALANKLISITHHLEDYLATIQNTCLMDVSRSTFAHLQHPPSLQELLKECAKNCDKAVEELVDTYEKLVTTLGSAGLLLAGAEEGAPEPLAAHIRASSEMKSRLASFLQHWKHNVQEAITMMLVNSIHGVEGWLEGKQVVFGVESNLTPTSTLTLTPPARTLTSTLADALGHTIRSAMAFRHWVELDDGTVALNPTPTADDDTLAACTFYSQVSVDPRLHAAVENFQLTFAKVIRELDVDLQSWYAYEHVWHRDKGTTVNRFCRSGPSVKEYDDKLRFYTHLASELSQTSHQVTHGCVSLDVRVLVEQIVSHAGEWVNLLGTGLLKEAWSCLQHVQHQVTTVNTALHQTPGDLASLTMVMRAVGQVSSEHAHLHTALLDVRQMFHTLHIYGIKVPESDHQQLEKTSEQLEALHSSAIIVQKAVQPVQTFYLSNTQKKVVEFSMSVKGFHKRFETQGPGAVGEDLERGVKLLKDYSEELAALLKQRQILDEEEDVFDLAATQYPELDSAVNAMSQLKNVFNIYQQLRSIEMTWHTMRWVTAKLDDLKDQVEGVQTALNKCPGVLETLVGQSLQRRLEDHITSLEVTAALRQPAIQTRHWQHLISAAGCGSKLASASGLGGVSVWDVLELRLSHHPQLVAATVTTAFRESLLNNQIKEINNFWQHARLCIKTATSVWSIEGLHELLCHLHHHSLALKALRSTRYHIPFENEASRLAKTLVMVGDLLEIWQDTQSLVSLLLSHAISHIADGTADLRTRHRHLLERTERRAFVLELAGNKGYIQEVLALQESASWLVKGLLAALARPRHQCPRLHLLTDHELIALMAVPTPETLDSVIHKTFNNVSSVKLSSEGVISLVSVEGEELYLPEAVSLAEENGVGGSDVGKVMQQLLDATHIAMKTSVRRAMEQLEKDGKLQWQVIQEAPVAALTVVWRLWWASSVDMALQACSLGDRHALRQKLVRVADDITFLLAVIGRVQHQEDKEYEEEDQEEPKLPLSSMRTVSGHHTTRYTSALPAPATRYIPLLMAAINARDVISTLIRYNATCTENFTWISQPRYFLQSQHANIELHVAHRIVEYGYEYSGCGQADFVITPSTERALLALFTAIAAHTPPLLLGNSGGGRNSLVAAAAQLAGRFTTTFILSALTSSPTVTSLLAGSLIGGSWLFLRDCAQATTTVLAILTSTLLNIHHAHTYTSSSPVIQIGGQEASLNPGAAVILTDTAPQQEISDRRMVTEGFRLAGSLPYSLEVLSRPICVTTPPPRTFVFAWLLAYGFSRAQEMSEAIDEVIRQVLGSYRDQENQGLRLYMRLTQEVVRIMADAQYTCSAMEAAVLAFKNVVVPRLPHNSLPAVHSVLDLIQLPSGASSPVLTSYKWNVPDLHEENMRSQASKIVLKMKLKIIPQQIEAIENVAQELSKWGCVVVAGPSRSGRMTIINAAVKVFQQEYGVSALTSACQHTPSTADKSTRSQGLEQSFINHSQLYTSDRPESSFDEIDEANIDILNLNRQLMDQNVFMIRPKSYSQTRLMGTTTQDGLLPCLLNQLGKRSSHSFVVLEGNGASECLLHLQDIPGTLLLDSLHALPPKRNITFVVKTSSLKEVPGWVLGRAGVIQVDSCCLSLETLLPRPEHISTPSATEHHSNSTFTPRTTSKSCTPISGLEEEPSPETVLKHLHYRLIHPALQLHSASSQKLHHFPVVDIIKQVQNLTGNDVDDVSTLDVAEEVQAVVQSFRSITDPVLLPELQRTLITALQMILTDGILDASSSEVVKSLASSSSPIYDLRWDATSSSWYHWQCVDVTGNESNSQETNRVGFHAIPTVDTQRLTWFLQKMVIAGQPLAVVGPPACGKTTAALLALHALPNWAIVNVSVTSATTMEDLEEVMLNHVTRAAYDTFIPSKPTVFCFDDVGSLSVDSSAQSYIHGLALHKGLYESSNRARWMNLVNVYIICVCTQHDSKTPLVEISRDFSGWAVYNMGEDKDACAASLSSALMPIASLQSQIHTALMDTTVVLAEKLMTLFRGQEEPFAPSNKAFIIWRLASTLRAAFSLFSLPSSSSGSSVLNVWLHGVTWEVLTPIYSNKVREHIWQEIQGCISEGCNGIVEDLPQTPPLCVWPPGLNAELPTNNDGPQYLNEEKASEEIVKVLISKGVADEPVCNHTGMVIGVAMVVDAVHHLFCSYTSPLLLLLSPSAGDMESILSLATSYLGIEKVTGETETKIFEVMKTANDGKASDAGVPPSPMFIVHVPTTLLQYPAVRKEVLEVASKEAVGHAVLYVVTGSLAEVWPLHQELRPAAQHGRVICMPPHKTHHHESFVWSLLRKNKLLQEENLTNQAEIAELITWIHNAYCSHEQLITANKMKDPRASSHIKQMPSVNAMAKLVTAFSELFQQKKKKVQTKVKELESVLHQMQKLKDHIQGLKENHGSLEIKISEATTTIENIKESLKKREVDIQMHDKCINDLHKEVASVEEAQEELSGDVTEYVEETEAPLKEITDTLAHLDIHRIRKLLDRTPEPDGDDCGSSHAPHMSRSPISAIQLVFECAVFLLGSADMSWRAVRHATQDDNFCNKLAAVCVPGLSQTVIVTLAGKLEQIKMTSEHMSRVSDIGGVLLQYLRTAVFFWHRYHEDVQPRQARVQALKDHKKQLQVELATKERLMRVQKEQVEKLTSHLKEEEGNVLSLKRQKMAIEKELDDVSAVTTKLNPHSERWSKEMDDQDRILKQITGQCLLAAARLTYLTSLEPESRERITRTWQEYLVTHGFLPEEHYLRLQDQFRLVSHAGDLQKDVQDAIDYQVDLNAFLLIHDPHYLIEDYVNGGTPVNMDVSSWQGELKERLMRDHQCVLYLRTRHAVAVEITDYVCNLLKGSVSNGNKQKVLLIVEDDCLDAACPLCSSHTAINIMLNQKGVAQQLVQILMRWHSPKLHEEVKEVMQAVSVANTDREKTEANLIHAISHTSNLTSTPELTSLMDHINSLNDATVLAIKHEDHVQKLTSFVAGQYLHVACYAAHLHQVTHTLAILNPSYALPLSLLQESIAHKISNLRNQEEPHENQKRGQDVDISHENEKMLEIVTSAVLELIDTRLKLQHRLIVMTCFALVRLNMKHKSEDYIKAFLTPMNLEQMIWDDISKSKPLKRQGNSKSEDDVEECAGNDREEEKESVHTENEQEEIIPEWIPKEADKKSRHVLRHLSTECISLFPAPTTTLEDASSSHLLLWLAHGTNTWPSIFFTADPLLQAAQRVLLSRHLREDLLVMAMTELVMGILGRAALKSDPDTLSQSIFLHSRKHITKRSGISDFIQVNVGRGANLPHILMEAAKGAGLPYYKLTFLSLATASQQELRRRVVMAARRRTWLVLLDCEVAPHSLSHIQRAILSLPSTLTTPTVFCVFADVSGSSIKLQNAIMAQVQRPICLSSTLAANLSIIFRNLQRYPSVTSVSAILTKAAVVTTGYIYSVLQARGDYDDHCWMKLPPLTETLLHDSLEFALKHSYTAYKSWDTLANILAKVICGSVVVSQLDQQIISRIFSDHLNDQMFSNLSRSMRSDKHSAHLHQSVEQPETSDATRTILLHSLPTGNVTLNLDLPSHKATESLCEQVEAGEAPLLGVYEGHWKTQQNRQILLALEVFTETSRVYVPAWTVLEMAAELLSTLPGHVSVLAEQVTREVNPETEAWQQEAKEWDDAQDKAQHQIHLIEQAVKTATIQPAEALLALADFVHSFLLHPDATVVSTTAKSGLDIEQASQKDVSVRMARMTVKGVKKLVKEWRERHSHLLIWAESETPPVVVRLSLFVAPGWWLTRFRQTVCIRAHWPLQGSVVHALPLVVEPAERPPQGVCITGVVLEGGCWTGKKVVPYDHGEKNCPVTLSLSVSHATPPLPVGQAWIPVLESATAKSPLFHALLPTESNLGSARPLYLLLH